MQLTKNFGYFNVMQNKGVSKKINKALVNMSIHIMIKAIFKDNSEYDTIYNNRWARFFFTEEIFLKYAKFLSHNIYMQYTKNIHKMYQQYWEIQSRS